MPPSVEPSSRIAGVVQVSFESFADPRGSFQETWRKTWLPGAREMVQGNLSFSKARVLRGMHYHRKQADFWSVPSGLVRAALYDFRERSPTSACSLVLEMGRGHNFGLYIPPGVAHGFCALEDSMMSYLVDEYYDGADELGIAWDDPGLQIDWAIAEPILSARDRGNPRMAQIPARLRP